MKISVISIAGNGAAGCGKPSECDHKEVDRVEFDMDADEFAFEKALRAADYIVDDIKQGKSKVTIVAILQSEMDNMMRSNLVRYYPVQKSGESFWISPRRSIYDGMPPGEEATVYTAEPPWW